LADRVKIYGLRFYIAMARPFGLEVDQALEDALEDGYELGFRQGFGGLGKFVELFGQGLGQGLVLNKNLYALVVGTAEFGVFGSFFPMILNSDEMGM
jgi:hypothetical protein